MLILFGYILSIIVNLLLSALSYEYFLEYTNPRQNIPSLIFAKTSILFVAVLDFLFLLLLMQFTLMSVNPFNDIVYSYFPKFLILFLSFAWIEGAREGYFFSIELVVYLTIVCSLFEYSVLKKKKAEINSKNQMIKAIVFPNMLTLIFILGWFVYLYNISPESFALLRKS